MRDYDTVKVEQEVPNEFLLVLDEGTDEFETDAPPGRVLQEHRAEDAAQEEAWQCARCVCRCPPPFSSPLFVRLAWRVLCWRGRECRRTSRTATRGTANAIW